MFNYDVEIVARKVAGKILRVILAMLFAPPFFLLAILADSARWILDKTDIFISKITARISKFEVSPKERMWGTLKEKQNDVDDVE
jgi:hypothetical protein